MDVSKLPFFIGTVAEKIDPYKSQRFSYIQHPHVHIGDLGFCLGQHFASGGQMWAKKDINDDKQNRDEK